MKKSLFLFIFCLYLPLFPLAVNATEAPTHLTKARLLLEKISPDIAPLFTGTNILLTDTDTDALAKYIPYVAGSDKPAIQFRKNLKLYQDDYVMLSSIIDRAHRPTFDHYLVILTALSLSNEWAHFQQDQNGSLKDLLKFRSSQNMEVACALYDLQQYVSDILMLETAYKLDLYFRQHNDLAGSLSVQMVLEKMWLDQIFWDYTIARTVENNEHAGQLFNEMRKIRYKVNMNGLKHCPSEPQNYRLDANVTARATKPIPTNLKPFVQLDQRP